MKSISRLKRNSLDKIMEAEVRLIELRKIDKEVEINWCELLYKRREVA